MSFVEVKGRGKFSVWGRRRTVREVARASRTSTASADTILLAGAVADAQAGNDEAFTWLFEYYRGSLGKHLYYLVSGDWNTAYDLYQDSFIIVYVQFKKGTFIPDFQPWLYRVATNLAIDYLRHKKKIMFVPLPESETDDPEEYALFGLLSEDGPEERVCEVDCIRRALAEMSLQYRTCVLLQDLCGYSQKEIAELLSITEKAVSSNVSRGRKQLREAYLRMVTELDETRKGGQIS